MRDPGALGQGFLGPLTVVALSLSQNNGSLGLRAGDPPCPPAWGARLKLFLAPAWPGIFCLRAGTSSVQKVLLWMRNPSVFKIHCQGLCAHLHPHPWGPLFPSRRPTWHWPPHWPQVIAEDSAHICALLLARSGPRPRRPPRTESPGVSWKKRQDVSLPGHHRRPPTWPQAPAGPGLPALSPGSHAPGHREPGWCPGVRVTSRGRASASRGCARRQRGRGVAVGVAR